MRTDCLRSHPREQRWLRRVVAVSVSLDTEFRRGQTRPLARRRVPLTGLPLRGLAVRRRGDARPVRLLRHPAGVRPDLRTGRQPHAGSGCLAVRGRAAGITPHRVDGGHRHPGAPGSPEYDRVRGPRRDGRAVRRPLDAPGGPGRYRRTDRRRPQQITAIGGNGVGNVFATLLGTFVLLFNVLLQLFIVVVIAFYLLRDDHRAASWARDTFAPRGQRRRTLSRGGRPGPEERLLRQHPQRDGDGGYSAPSCTSR